MDSILSQRSQERRAAKDKTQKEIYFSAAAVADHLQCGKPFIHSLLASGMDGCPNNDYLVTVSQYLTDAGWINPFEEGEKWGFIKKEQWLYCIRGIRLRKSNPTDEDVEQCLLDQLLAIPREPLSEKLVVG